MKPKVVFSAFDGYSGGQLALQRAGIPVKKYYASEVDKYAIQITQKNFPNTIQLGDVKKCNFLGLEKVDILMGGSPCQGFSFAGKGLNFEDPRSKLFFEFVRLKEELVPKYFFLENVNMKKEYQDVISGYLGCEPIVVNSALLSAQNRVRLYWTNIPNFIQPKDKEIIISDITIDGFGKIGAMRGRYIVDGKRQDGKMKVAGLTTQRIEPRKDEKSNCVTTVGKDNLVLKKIININPSGRGMNGWVYNTEGKAPTVTTNKGEENKIGIYQLNPSLESNGNQPYQQNRIYDINGKHVALTASLGGRYKIGQMNDQDIIYRTLHPIECERLQTLPDNYTEGVSNSQRYKMLGNGWNVDTIVEFFKHIK